MNAEHEKLLQDIERNEGWLAEQMAAHGEPACARLDEIRDQVRIAVHLASLEVAPPVPPSAEVLDGVKAAIRVELGATPRVVRPARQPWIAMVGAAGLAAAACLAFLVASQSLEESWTSRPVAVSPLDEFLDVLNTNGVDHMPAGDDVTAALASTVDDRTDAGLDELADELDELLAEFEIPFEV